MKFGLAFASSVGTDPASAALEVAKVAEAVGFESVWGGEHVVMPSTIASAYPYTSDGKIPATPETLIPDPLIWLAYVAAVAPTLRLGTCILILPQRNPLVLAKELATLDHLSGGRVELGIGVGWMKEEFDALDAPWEHRGRRNDEYVAVLRHHLVRQPRRVPRRVRELRTAHLRAEPCPGARHPDPGWRRHTGRDPSSSATC